MLRSVGLGIAVENAHEDVKKIADILVSSNNFSGVSEAINNFAIRR
jgi:hydroxymethylpyrimidine pyrophosphatase-like HAD family hydrolase